MSTQTGRKRARSDDHDTYVSCPPAERYGPSSTTDLASEEAVRSSEDSISHLETILSQKPLSDGRSQIRLLRLSKNCEGVLHLSIDIQNFKKSMSYVAISYTWGPEESPRNIFVDGQKCSVRKNCHDALQQTCRHMQDVQCALVWIDSICINQRDEQEKSLQVSIMGDIYANAAHVFACVGLHADDSVFLVEQARTVSDFKYDCSHDDFLCTDCREPWERWALNLGIKSLSRVCKACEKFGRRGYWNRVWIIQETAKATSLSVLCGADLLPWKVLNNLEGVLGLELDEMTGVTEKYRSLPTCETNTMHEVLIARKQRVQVNEVFSLYSDSICQDPRDHLYGLLSLIEWPDNTTPMFPDYRKSAFELALDVQAHVSFEKIPGMLKLFEIDSETVTNLVVERRTKECSRVTSMTNESGQSFRPIYEHGGSCTCACIREDEQNNLTAALVNLTYSHGFMSHSSDPDDSSDDSWNSEDSGELASKMMSSWSSTPQDSIPKALVLGKHIAGFVCNETMVGDVLVPVRRESGDFFLVLRHHIDENYEVIGQALVIPGYEFGCSTDMDDPETGMDLFTAEVAVKMSAEDIVALFAQDMDRSMDAFNEENWTKRVFTRVTSERCTSARLSMQSRLRAKDVTRTGSEIDGSTAGSLIEFIKASKKDFGNITGEWAVGAFNDLPHASHNPGKESSDQ